MPPFVDLHPMSEAVDDPDREDRKYSGDGADAEDRAMRQAILYFSDPDRPYQPPRMYQRHPKFTEDEVRGCFEALEQKWNPTSFHESYSGYNRTIRHVRTMVSIPIVGWIVLIVIGAIFGPGPIDAMIAGSLPVALLVLVGYRVLLRGPTFSSGVFYRELLRAERIAWIAQGDNGMIAASIGRAGRAARALFRSLQGSRWTWTAPPAVADRGVLLSYPLIDVNVADDNVVLNSNLFCYLYSRFLHDVSGLVMMGRPDLIPPLRDRYPFLMRRLEGEESGQPSDRDVRYLDPLRDHDRGRMFREFVLPLASWLSFLVALAALIVALSK